MQFLKKGISAVAVQVIAWMVIIGIIFLMMFHENEPVVRSAIVAVIYCSFFAAVIYVNALWLVPYLYRRRHTLLYLLAVLLLLGSMTWLLVQTQVIVEKIFATTDMPVKPVPLRAYLVIFFLQTLVYIFTLPLRLAFDYFTVRRQQELLQKRTAEAELNLLKAQVQPHFLFNTLNNIYFVAQRESPTTAEWLERLSNIMRYFVDEGPKQQIPLTTETAFISDYIHLEQLRMRYPVAVTVQVEGDPNGVDIPPMLLIPLVENVFKHGINKRSDNNLLRVQIQVAAQQLQVEVVNRIWEDMEPVKGGGNGLSNLKARLELLYGSRYELHTRQHEGLFIANVKIPV